MAGRLSSVHRTLVDALRTAMVWLVEIGIFYGTKSSFCSEAGQLQGQCFGTKWATWSPLQLVGFAMIVVGTLMYNAVIRLPNFYYPTTEQSKLPSIAGYASPLQMMLSPITRQVSKVIDSPEAKEISKVLGSAKTEFEAHLLGGGGEL